MKLQSNLIVLSSGQVVGHPVTRRRLKRNLRKSRLQRRNLYRYVKAHGVSYDEARQLVKTAFDKTW